MINTLKDIEIRNKKVLIRVDFNVPIEDGEVKDTFRLDSTVDTIEYCLSQNASIILMSHLGRPKGHDENYSLYPIMDYLEEKFNVYVHFSNDCISNESISVSNKMLKKEIHLLENLRFYDEEMLNDKEFAKKLSNHADVYVNDAFGLSHRSHASNSQILKFFDNKCIGALMEKEITNLSEDIDSDSVIIIGGAKISTKIKMIENYINKASHILIGGAMAFTFLKAQNISIGLSLFEEEMIAESKKILSKIGDSKTSLVLPTDFVCSKDINSDDTEIYYSNNIPDTCMGLDIGPETSMQYSMILSAAKKVIWNGPMGMFEKNRFATGTQSLAYDIKEFTSKNSLNSIVGGGDTVRAIKAFTDCNCFSHVSTGGGASLKLLSGEKLNFVRSWNEN